MFFFSPFFFNDCLYLRFSFYFSDWLITHEYLFFFTETIFHWLIESLGLEFKNSSFLFFELIKFNKTKKKLKLKYFFFNKPKFKDFIKELFHKESTNRFRVSECYSLIELVDTVVFFLLKEEGKRKFWVWGFTTSFFFFSLFCFTKFDVKFNSSSCLNQKVTNKGIDGVNWNFNLKKK